MANPCQQHVQKNSNLIPLDCKMRAFQSDVSCVVYLCPSCLPRLHWSSLFCFDAGDKVGGWTLQLHKNILDFGWLASRKFTIWCISQYCKLKLYFKIILAFVDFIISALWHWELVTYLKCYLSSIVEHYHLFINWCYLPLTGYNY